ncbi:tyrosine kinase receptor Cad96Ca-like [Diadema setosum]|uniref:tyrosine kinase receptor Cad96Ca-like n=1 Tax=Diadema setosum TaxID=31175 RepID=UPI003B3B3F2C
MIAVVSIMGVLLAVSVAVNILQFYKQTTASSQEQSVSAKHARTDIPGDNDNSVYEMIECGSKGNAVYEPLTPSSAAVQAENLTFFSRLGSIGLGKFGDVWKGDFNTKQGVASVALRQITEKVPDLLQMVEYLQKLPNHQNTVTCLGYCEEYRTIVHEFVAGGTLLTYLQSPKSFYGNIKRPRPRFDESKLLKYAWQVAKGMEFLASNKIIHGHLCAHNILMTEDRICKISDYGMTSFMSPAGNPTRWMSPEGMQNKNWSLEGDVWSYGILLWEIVTLGARPYPKMTMDMVKEQVSNGYKMPRPSHCGEELYSIMTSCWEMEPEKRCSYYVIQRKLEPIMEVFHDEYLSLQNLDEKLYDFVADMTV